MIYEYRHDTGINDAELDWYRVSDVIQSKPAYTPLDSFGFVDDHALIKKG